MDLFGQTVALGILLGGVYALMGVGLNLIFGVMRVANFAHGALYAVGGYSVYVCVGVLHLPVLASVAVSMVVGAAVGFGINSGVLRVVYRTRMERTEEFTLVVTFALSLIAQSLFQLSFTADYRRISGLWPGAVSLFDVWSVSGNLIVAFLSAGVLLGALLWLVKYTNLGRGWRALTQNRTGAQIVGADVFWLSNAAFGVSAALAAAAGALLVPLYLAYPTMGEPALVKSFVIVVLGGLGSVYGSLFGGFILGLAEALGAVYVSSSYTEAYGFIIMLLVLLFLPKGLFGSAVREV